MSRLRSLAVGLALLAAFAAPVRAANDEGGTAGVFGTGAGSRSLALGGATTALPEGPWSWTWNPGGLAWLPRASAEFVQGSPDAIGAREMQGALAVPDGRLGVLALSWRQFGVDGIDGRDARGEATGTFDDRESELGIAYAHDVAATLGLGAAFKLRRQSLAGRSDGAIGADVGASLRLAGLDAEGPWRDVAFGVRFGNAIQPTVKLDRDDVGEPSSWTGGVTWQHATGASRLTLSADLQQLAGGLVHERVGAEWGWRGLMQLRAGWDGERVAAGTGVQWRDAEVAYAFRSNPLGDEHRVGLTWQFGRSVAESRELAAAAREKEIQQRLQTAYDDELARRTQSLLAEARQALAAGDVDEAWARASVLDALAPGRPEAVALMVNVLAARGARLERAGDWDGARVEYEKALAFAPADTAVTRGAARCRDEGDRRARRGTEQRRLVDGVLRGIATGNLVAARARVDSLRASGVADSTIAPLLLRLERVTASQVDSRLEQVARLTQAGMYDDAARALEAAAALAPGSPAVARARQQLAAAKPAPARASAATPLAGTPAVGEAARREADQLYRSGLDAFRGGNADLAVRSWELAILKNPQHAQVRDLLKREYLTRGLDAFSSGRLANAVDYWQRALQLDPSDARTRSYLDRAQEHLSRSAELGVTR